MAYDRRLYQTEWAKHCCNKYRKIYKENEEERHYFCVEHNIKEIGNNQFYFTINDMNYRLSSRVNTMDEAKTMRVFKDISNQKTPKQRLRSSRRRNNGK